MYPASCTSQVTWREKCSPWQGEMHLFLFLINMLESFHTSGLLNENIGCICCFLLPFPLSYPTLWTKCLCFDFWRSLILSSKNVSHLRWGEVSSYARRREKVWIFEGLTQWILWGWQDAKVRYWKIRFMLLCQWGWCKLTAWQRRWCVVWTSRKRKSATQIKNYPVGHPKMILTSAEEDRQKVVKKIKKN